MANMAGTRCLNLNGIRRNEPILIILAIIYDGQYIRRGLCAHVIECLSCRSGG